MSQLQKYYGLANMMIPEEGPRAVPANLEFDAGGVIDIDGLLVSTNGVIGFVQGAYADNSANALPFSIRCGVTNQVVTWPPNSQGYLPLLIPNPPNMTATLEGATGGEKVNIYFYNVPMQAAVWSTVGGGGGGGAVDLTAIDGQPIPDTALPVFLSPGFAPSFSDYPLVLDGTSQDLLASGNGTVSVYIQNPVGNADITVNLVGGDALAGGIVIPGGEKLVLDRGLANNITVAGTLGESVVVYAAS